MAARYNPYKQALLNPISGPLVGVPTPVPVDTHRARLKATGTITLSTGTMSVMANPVHALCNDALTAVNFGFGSNQVGPIVYNDNTFIDPTFVAGAVDGNFLSNASYTRSQFAGVATNGASSVRGRVVSACLRICNVSAANTRNGVFTLFHDPQHTTLQGKTASTVATDPKARQYNASSEHWHTITYHPVEPEEVDGWVWDPAVGPQAGVKTGTYNTGGLNDGTVSDNFPGYMGIFWRGDAVSQTFQVELYVIAEYVGSLVQPLIRDIGVNIEDAQAAREAAEAATVHAATSTDASNHSGHPGLLDTIKHVWEKVPAPIRGALKRKAEDYVYNRVTGGVGKKMQKGAMLLAPEFAPEIAIGGMIARRAMPYAKALARTVTGARQRKPQPGDLSYSRGDFRYRGPARGRR